MDEPMDPDPSDSSQELVPGSPAPESGPNVVADLPSKVLATKEGETFMYSDMDGGLDDRTEVGVGLYHRATRYLSRLRLTIWGRKPVLLSSSAERAFVSYVGM